MWSTYGFMLYILLCICSIYGQGYRRPDPREFYDPRKPSNWNPKRMRARVQSRAKPSNLYSLVPAGDGQYFKLAPISAPDDDFSSRDIIPTQQTNDIIKGATHTKYFSSRDIIPTQQTNDIIKYKLVPAGDGQYFKLAPISAPADDFSPRDIIPTQETNDKIKYFSSRDIIPTQQTNDIIKYKLVPAGDGQYFKLAPISAPDDDFSSRDIIPTQQTNDIIKGATHTKLAQLPGRILPPLAQLPGIIFPPLKFLKPLLPWDSVIPLKGKETNDKIKLAQSPFPLIVLPLEVIKKRIIKDFLKRYNGTVIPTQEKQTNGKIKLADIDSPYLPPPPYV